MAQATEIQDEAVVWVEQDGVRREVEYTSGTLDKCLAVAKHNMQFGGGYTYVVERAGEVVATFHAPKRHIAGKGYV